MTDYLYVLALALMPAFGNFTGGVLAELTSTSLRMLSRALHAAAGIVLAEGFATIANFKDKGQPRGRPLLLSASFVIPCLLGASVGYWLLRDGSETLKLTALAFTAGILLLAAVEEMLQEAHEAAEDTRSSAAFFIGGFALFTLVASYFGG